MRSLQFSLGVAGVLATCLFSLSAHANSAGKIGHSGKNAATTCMLSGCHGTNSAASTPTVRIEGPQTLEAGATGNYTLIITGGPAMRAGMNVAVSNNGGTLDKVGNDVKVDTGELTHSAAKQFTASEARFDFKLVAPASAGTTTIFGIGNSTNGDFGSDGDRAVPTTVSVTITGGSNPDPKPDPGEDDGGCSATGGAPLMALLGLLAAAGLRRRSA